MNCSNILVVPSGCRREIDREFTLILEGKSIGKRKQCPRLLYSDGSCPPINSVLPKWIPRVTYMACTRVVFWFGTKITGRREDFGGV